MSFSGFRVSGGGAAWLDSLPPEVFEKIVSFSNLSELAHEKPQKERCQSVFEE